MSTVTMRSLLTFVIPAAVIGLVMTSPAPAPEKENTEEAKRNSPRVFESGGAYSCIVNGYSINHGDVFTLQSSKCIKYKCNQGSYYTVEEACELNGACYPVGQVVQYQCRHYQCQVSSGGGGYRYFSLNPVGSQQCQDFYGQCRSPGERFAYNVRGVLKGSCTCQVTGGTIQYICYD